MPTELNVQTSGSGPPILFVHGLDSDATVWDPVIDLLQDHLCIAVDLPGHGASPTSDDPSRYERHALLADLDDVLADVAGPPILVGHSLGGSLALCVPFVTPRLLPSTFSGALTLVAVGSPPVQHCGPQGRCDADVALLPADVQRARVLVLSLVARPLQSSLRRRRTRLIVCQ